MNWIETLIIVCGLSMDVFASVECQGAMLAKIRTKQLEPNAAPVRNV